MGIEWQAVIGAVVGIFIKHLFPGLIPTAQPAVPAPSPSVPVNNTPKSNLEALLVELIRELQLSRLVAAPKNPTSSQTGPA